MAQMTKQALGAEPYDTMKQVLRQLRRDSLRP
jgi:hypothetical protein